MRAFLIRVDNVLILHIFLGDAAIILLRGEALVFVIFLQLF